MTSAAPANFDTPPTDARFLRAFWRLVRWALPARFQFFGLYEYRIAKAYPGGSSPTVALDLQATEATVALGLDDLRKVEAWPGIAGSVPAATAGARVLVSFIGGDAGRPVVLFWAPNGDAGWLPSALAIDTTGRLTLGASSADVVMGNPTVPSRLVRENDIYTFGTLGSGVIIFVSSGQPSGATRAKG